MKTLANAHGLRHMVTRSGELAAKVPCDPSAAPVTFTDAELGGEGSKDEWGNPFLVRCIGNIEDGLEVISLGEDEKLGTRDDIISTQPGGRDDICAPCGLP